MLPAAHDARAPLVAIFHTVTVERPYCRATVRRSTPAAMARRIASLRSVTACLCASRLSCAPACVSMHAASGQVKQHPAPRLHPQSQ